MRWVMAKPSGKYGFGMLIFHLHSTHTSSTLHALGVVRARMYEHAIHLNRK